LYIYIYNYPWYDVQPVVIEWRLNKSGDWRSGWIYFEERRLSLVEPWRTEAWGGEANGCVWYGMAKKSSGHKYDSTSGHGFIAGGNSKKMLA